MFGKAKAAAQRDACPNWISAILGIALTVAIIAPTKAFAADTAPAAASARAANGQLCRGDQRVKPTLKNDQINIRDTFILVHDCKYYLYGTRGESAFSNSMDGYDVYVSNDLQNWEGPKEVYHTTRDNWATRRFWAPEVHNIGRTFYMFMAWGDANSRQTPTILSSKSPLGPFKLYSGPFFKGSEGNDLTIWEEDQKLNVVLNFETKGSANGVYYAPMNKTLTGFTDVPKLMFTSEGCTWCTQQPVRFHDGAWLHKLSDGTLISLWSQMSAKGYSIGVVESSNGRLDGAWKHHPELLVTGGGHGMLFTSVQGKLMMATHMDAAPQQATPPNAGPQRVTRPHFFEVQEDLPNKTLKVIQPPLAQ